MINNDEEAVHWLENRFDEGDIPRGLHVQPLFMIKSFGYESDKDENDLYWMRSADAASWPNPSARHEL